MPKKEKSSKLVIGSKIPGDSRANKKIIQNFSFSPQEFQFYFGIEE